jgi:hypothetical protein
MTVCVAVNTAKHAQPRYNNVRLEPGIIMLADTRVTNTLTGEPLANDIVKVDFLSDYAVGGYSGNTIVAEKALSDIDDKFRKLSEPDPAGAVQIARRILSANLNSACASSSTKFTVLIGVKDFSLKGYRLYYLGWENDFLPIERTGLCAIGSHGRPFADIYSRILNEGQGLQNNPFTKSKMPIWGENSFANLLVELLSLELETASEVEGPRALIGGFPRVLTLTDTGTSEAVGHQVFENGIPRLELYQPVLKYGPK